ncbi:MAG: hypothetical protein ACP5M9_03160 [Candidatus Micrarchaeia archaeon]
MINKTKIAIVGAFAMLLLLQFGFVGASSIYRMNPNASASGGFLNSTEVTFVYSGNYTCNKIPSNTFGSTYANEINSSFAFTSCVVGIGQNTTGKAPLWVAIPAYAGLSIFGINALGASSQGYPIFEGNVIVTNCGGGISNTSCPDHPKFLYSPDFTLVEQHLNITKGVFGLPEGVLPTPAHTHIINTNASGKSIGWYVISVLVFDPNIMPNATTGKCTQIVASNLSDPTGNCLTSLSAIEKAMVTQSSSVALANEANPIWQTLGGPKLQVIIPGISLVTEINNSDTNLAIPFAVVNKDYYTLSQVQNMTTTPQTTTQTVPATTQQTTTQSSPTNNTAQQSQSQSQGQSLIYIIVIAIIIIIVIVAVAMKMMKKN